jgi:hypothetical protein
MNKSQNRRNQLFLLDDKRRGSGSVHLINGSGSRRPKNILVLRIRIRNTGCIVTNLPLIPDTTVFNSVRVNFHFFTDKFVFVSVRYGRASEHENGPDPEHCTSCYVTSVYCTW